MRVLTLFATTLALLGQSASPPPATVPVKDPVAASVPGDSVVATINGRKYTADDIRKLVAGSPPQVRSVFERDPKQFLREHAFLMSLVAYSEKNNLQNQSPNKETLEFYRMYVLSNAALNHYMQTIDVTPEELNRYYGANESNFRELRVRMIYVPLEGTDGEAKSLTKAAAIAKRARAGEDFVKLAQEFTEDKTGAGGDFSVRRDSRNPPEQMKSVLFGMKAGEITDPLKHENGYYVFRVESAGVIPYDKARNEVYRTLQDEKFRHWQERTRSEAAVQFENEAFFQSIGQRSDAKK